MHVNIDQVAVYALLALLVGLLARWSFQGVVRDVRREFTANGGSSMKDQVNNAARDAKDARDTSIATQALLQQHLRDHQSIR